MAEISDFEQWANASELSADTRQLLVGNGVSSLKACRNLNETIIQKHFSKALSLGQLLLLQAGVAQLQTTDVARPRIADSTKGSNNNVDNVTAAGTGEADVSPTGVPQSSAAVDVDYSKVFELFNSAAQPATPNVGKAETFDPLLCLHSKLAAKSSKDIRDYIMFGQQYKPTSGEGHIIKIGDHELSLKDKKIAVDRITQLQYMEGALKILAEMITDDHASTPVVLQHVNYLTKIACMGQMFAWPSVLRYDAEYRKYQAHMGFAWASDSPFLMQLLLKRPDSNINAPQRFSANRTPKHRGFRSARNLTGATGVLS